MDREAIRKLYLTDLLAYCEMAQREGFAFTTAYGAYRQQGGQMPATRFRWLWRMAKVNPFRFQGVS